jgi:hypothetical protein
VEHSLATLIEQLSRLPIAPMAPVGPNIPAVTAMPAKPAEVAEIITRNKRYEDVQSVNTYRLRDKSPILKPEQVATLRVWPTKSVRGWKVLFLQESLLSQFCRFWRKFSRCLIRPTFQKLRYYGS